MRYEIEVKRKEPEIVIDDIKYILPDKKIKVEFARLYLIDADLDVSKVKEIIDKLLKDRVVEKAKIKGVKEDYFKKTAYKDDKKSDTWLVKVYYRPEVTDPGSETIKKALKDIKVKVKEVETGKQYILHGKGLDFKSVELLTRRIFANQIVENVIINVILK